MGRATTSAGITLTRTRKTPEGEPAGWRPPDELRQISLNSVADLLDASRSSVRRWLAEAGIQPIAVGSGRKGAIRYRWLEVREWVESLKRAE